MVLSLDAETAMLVFVRLCPRAREVIGPWWDDSVRSGVYDDASVETEKERREGNDQTCICASAAPDSACRWFGDTDREVTGSRWDAGVVTRRPVESYFSGSASLSDEKPA